MAVYLYDVSNHQSTTPNLDGWSGLIAKASEGSDFRDGRFSQHRSNTLNAGKVFGAYHFLRSDSSIADQVDTFLSVVGPNDPVIPDVEWIKSGNTMVSAPTLAQTREFIQRLRDRGRYIPMIYLPRWYWQYWGSPDISDFPPLWLSRYPDYISRPREQAYQMVGPQSGFGGARAIMTQFTSSPLDQNAFEGTHEQLVEVFGGQATGDDVSFSEQLTDHNGNTYSAGQWVTWTNTYVIEDLEESREIRKQQAVDSAKLDAVVAALADGEGIDEDRLNATTDKAVREATTTAVTRTVLPALHQVLTDVLNDDNAELSAETARLVLDGMAARLGTKSVAE